MHRTRWVASFRFESHVLMLSAVNLRNCYASYSDKIVASVTGMGIEKNLGRQIWA